MVATPKYPVERYSSLEEERVRQLREKAAELELSDELKDDAHLIRWLRARNLDVEKAFEMLKLSLEWRKDNKIDGILKREDVPEEFRKQTPYATLGCDYDGYPIILVPMGRQDGRAMLEKYGADDCFRFNIINVEKLLDMLRKLSTEQGRQVAQVVHIIDCEGYSYRQLTSKLCREFMIRMQNTFDANYPELLRYGLVINAPKIFYILFKIMKPFIPKQTLEKVDIYGPEPDKWKKVIADRFPLENIPPHWGGTMKGSDEYCSKDKIWTQGPVPLSYFDPNFPGSTEEEDMTNWTTVTIAARDTHKITLDVDNPTSSIAYRFRSDNHDIGFQILYSNNRELVPYSRVQSHKQIQEGSETCGKQDTFTVIFDNSYSYARSKIIHYHLSVIEATP